MTGAGRPLDWTEIESYLIDVGAELERRGLVRTIIMVGGAYVAYRGVRASTTDVDTIYELDDDLRAGIAAVARRHGLDPTGSTTELARGDPSPSTLRRAKPFSRRAASASWCRSQTSSS